MSKYWAQHKAPKETKSEWFVDILYGLCWTVVILVVCVGGLVGTSYVIGRVVGVW